MTKTKTKVYVYLDNAMNPRCKECKSLAVPVYENVGYEPPNGPRKDEIVGHKCDCGYIEYE